MKIIPDAERCIHYSSSPYRNIRCTARAKLDGYCLTHNPTMRKAKLAARIQAWTDKLNARQAEHLRSQRIRELQSALSIALIRGFTNVTSRNNFDMPSVERAWGDGPFAEPISLLNAICELNSLMGLVPI